MATDVETGREKRCAHPKIFEMRAIAVYILKFQRGAGEGSDMTKKLNLMALAMVAGISGIASYGTPSYGPTGPTWNPGGGGSTRKASKSTKAKRRNESSGRKAARKRK